MGHGTGSSGGRRREDDTNYDDVNMDMSEVNFTKATLKPP